MNFKKVMVTLTTVLGMTLLVSACGTKETGDTGKSVTYPEKTIKIVNVLPPNTPPDLVVRKIAGAIEQKKGWKFEFENIPVNGGADAINKVWSAPHDGYTILGQTEGVLGLSTKGLTTTSTKDWTYFETFQEISAVVVKTDSPYKTIEDLVNAAKNKPGTIKIGQPSNGSSFDFKLSVIEKITGTNFENKEFLGGVTLIPSLLDGSIDAAIIPMAIAMEDIKAGNVRPIILTDAGSNDFGGNIGKVESITKVYPEFTKYLPLDPVIGLAMPADAPKEVVEEFGKAFEEVMDSPEMSAQINSIYAIKINLWGDNAKDYMSKMESNYAWLVKDLGQSKVDPESLGIQKAQWVK